MSNETQETICQWANDTLGIPSTNLSIAERALKEMKELLVGLDEDDQDPNAPLEAADVFIVLMRIFESYGTTWQEEVDKKMAINRARTWVRDGNGHGSHVKAPQVEADVTDTEINAFMDKLLVTCEEEEEDGIDWCEWALDPHTEPKLRARARVHVAKMIKMFR